MKPAPLARPVFHHAPKGAWMNDPVGLVRRDGLWRLHYQRADDVDQRAMGWGAAESADLLVWRDRGVALAPGAEAGWIYSGSVIEDGANVSGLGPGAAAPLLAFYTRHDPETGLQRQDLAVSTEAGVWTRHPGNPLVDEQRTDQRDPFVFAYEQGWRMVLAEPVAWNSPDQGRSRFALYSSRDLLGWTRVGSLGVEGGPCEMFETPVLAEMTIEGEADRVWLLLAGVIDRGGGGAACSTRAWIGAFDGAVFTPFGAPQRLDHGPDFYAAARWAGVEGVMVSAWLNSWAYARRLPGADWGGGAHSAPRRLSVSREESGALRLRHAPVIVPYTVEIATGAAPAGQTVVCEAVPLAALLELHVSGGSAVLELSCGGSEVLRIGADADSVWLERDGPAGAALGSGFAGRWNAPLDASPDRSLVVFLDGCTAETFTADGAAALSALVIRTGPGALTLTVGDGAQAIYRIHAVDCPSYPES